jgi:broad specificity phosphatase PhoE
MKPNWLRVGMMRKLSKLGLTRAQEMSERRLQRKIDIAFASDLSRAYQTATLAMGYQIGAADPFKVFADWRLRECNYGDFTRKPKEFIESERLKRIHVPFPNGESYTECMARMKSFIDDIKLKFDDKTILVVGSRATHYGLEHWILGKSIEQCIREEWKWQPGWHYELP